MPFWRKDSDEEAALNGFFSSNLTPLDLEAGASAYGIFIDFVAYGTAIKNRPVDSPHTARLKQDPLFVLDLKGKSKGNLRYLCE